MTLTPYVGGRFSMLPKDVHTLIENYNEDGEYVIASGGIFWFNGKRIEFWCSAGYMNDIQCYNHKIYSHWSNEGYCLIGNQFELTNDKVKWDSNHECINGKLEYIYKTRSYFYSRFENVFTRLPSKTFEDYGFKMVLVENYIYYFSRHKIGINEKFDINTKTWSLIAKNPSHVHGVILLHKIIYILFDCGRFAIYHPQSDLFLETKLNLPKEYKLNFV